LGCRLASASYTQLQSFIRQHPVGVFHPTFAKIAYFSGDPPVAKAELRSAHLNHVVP